MTTRLSLIMLVAALVGVASCKKKEVVASFDVDKTKTIDISHNFSFTNTSQNAVKYEWDFGDGSTSTMSNPRHTYSEKGQYSVQLTAINDKGDFQVIDELITIGDWTVTYLDMGIENLNSSGIIVKKDSGSNCNGITNADIKYIKNVITVYSNTEMPLNLSEKIEYGYIPTDLYVLYSYCDGYSDIAIPFSPNENRITVNGQSGHSSDRDFLISEFLDEEKVNEIAYNATPIDVGSPSYYTLTGSEGFIEVAFLMEIQ